MTTKIFKGIIISALLVSSLSYAQNCSVYFDSVLKNLWKNPSQLQQFSRSNQIGVDLMTSALKTNGVKNSMFSAVSLQTAVAMLIPAAQNLTQKTVFNFLYQPGKTLDENFFSLQSSLLTKEKVPDAPPSRFSGLSPSSKQPTIAFFKIANSAWSTNGASSKDLSEKFIFHPDYIQSLESNFGATVRSIDFKQESGAQEINRWADEKTNGLVKEIVTKDLLEPMSWALLNAAYFEGSWAHTFLLLEKSNKPLKFNTLDGTSPYVDAIRSEKPFTTALIKDETATTVEIPFSGGKYSLVVVMPSEATEQGLAAQGSALLSQKYTELRDSKQYAKVDITMPKFAFDTSIAMQGQDAVSESLGLAPLFSNQSNFTKMAAEDSPVVYTKVGLIKQNTRVELDEKGMRAAAVSAVFGIGITSMNPEIPVRVIIDRTFLFAIVENSTGTILFNGIVTDPTQN